MGTDIHTDGRILGSPSGLPFPALGFTTLGHTDFGVPLWTPLSSTRVYNPRTLYQHVSIYTYALIQDLFPERTRSLTSDPINFYDV
jgi:hypothetical protein